MTDMENKMRGAGVAVDDARLTELAFNVLRRTKRNKSLALRLFKEAVTSDAKLLAALVGWETINTQAQDFLLDREQDMKGPTGKGVSHPSTESQGAFDHPTPTNSTSRRSSHASDESQVDFDRPPAPGTAISRKAAVAATKVGIWGERVVSHFEKRYGEICQYDYINLGITDKITSELHKGLAKVEFPDMWTQLQDFADPKLIEKIRDRVNATRDKAVKAAKKISHDE